MLLFNTRIAHIALSITKESECFLVFFRFALNEFEFYSSRCHGVQNTKPFGIPKREDWISLKRQSPKKWPLKYWLWNVFLQNIRISFNAMQFLSLSQFRFHFRFQSLIHIVLSCVECVCTQFVWSMKRKITKLKTNGNGILGAQQWLHWHLKIITNYSIFEREHSMKLQRQQQHLCIKREKNRSVWLAFICCCSVHSNLFICTRTQHRNDCYFQ